MNLTLAITPLNASAIPASWLTLPTSHYKFNSWGGCAGTNTLLGEPADRYGFTRVLPQKATAPSAESVTRDVVNAAINRVKDRFGVHQAKHIIQVVGGSLRMLDIAPDRFPHVLATCQWLEGTSSNDPSKYHWIHRFDSNGAYLGFTDR